ncbi:MAG: ribosome-associated translation inhibitor RaiA [Candidatus Pacebacteria bacterium]|nr:ribosome-associated translation inhibitor RaiA [Candidatus Paceibacterota bacterium]
MFTVSFKGTLIDITPAIRSYSEEKVRAFEKFFDGETDEVFIALELGLTTRHHQQGDIFRAEITLKAPRISLRAEAEKSDLYVAIDTAKDEMISELKKSKGRHQTMIRKGGRVIKDIMRKMGFGE